MSDFVWKEGKGGLFLNKGKGPQLKGQINIDGKVIKLAAWEKETKGGDLWYAIEVDTFIPRKRSDAEAAPKPSQYPDDMPDDQIPF